MKMIRPGLWPLILLALALLLPLWGAGAARAAAAWDDEVLKVGVLEEPKSLNLWLASDAWSKRVIRLIYEPLYVREPVNLQIVPWLAAALPEFDAKAKTFTIRLREAKWSDGTPFTAHDVAFTAELIQKFKLPRYSSLWSTVKKIEVLDERTIRFTVKKVKANFLSRTLATPIVQKKQWAAIAVEAKKAKKPLSTLLQFRLEKPIGTGPFMLKEWRSGVYVYMLTNPHFFARGLSVADHTLGPYIQGILFKVFGTSDAAVLALRKGDIDFYWNGIQAGYISQLDDAPEIKLFTSQKSALYYLGFNLRHFPTDNTAFRRAVAALVNKDFIISRVMQGQGTPMPSVVPPGNTFFHCSDVDKHGQGLDRDQRIKLAYDILTQAGFTWKVPPIKDGKVQSASELMGPDGKPVKDLTILTPPADYDPNRAMAGMLIQEWCRKAGLPVSARPMSFGALIQQVKNQHKFDMFVLGYGRLDLDPGYLWYFFHSKQDKKRGWNMSGFKDAAYDKLADKSEYELDPLKRREMIFEMQKIIMSQVPYLPLYNPLLVEGVRTDRFRGWVEAVEGIGNLWSFCTIRPVKAVAAAGRGDGR